MYRFTMCPKQVTAIYLQNQLFLTTLNCYSGAIQVLRNAVVGGWVSAFPEKKRYDGVRFNVISVTRGWVGLIFPGKKRYVTLEWPPDTTIYKI